MAGCEPVPRVGGEAAGEIGEITEDVPVSAPRRSRGEEVIQLSDFRPAPAAGAAPIKGWLRVVAPGPNPDRVRRGPCDRPLARSPRLARP